jgi:acetyl esterase/lipase
MVRWSTSGGPWTAWLAIPVIGLLLTLAAPVQAQEEVSYGGASGQVADLYAAGAPVLVLVTGDGWISNEPAIARPFARALQAAGVTVLVPRYTVGAPAAAEADVAQAVSFAAQLPGRGRLTLGGHSAGAHLAAMVGLDQTRDVGGLLLLSGIYDLPGAVQDGGIAAWLVQQAFGRDASVWQARSPQARVRAEAPATWIVHGASDRDVSPRRATAFATRLRETGSPVTLSLLPNTGHVETPLALLLQQRDDLLDFLGVGQSAAAP